MIYKKVLHKIPNRKVFVNSVDPGNPAMGFGLFAKKEIKKGEIIFLAKGKQVRIKIKDKTDSALLPNAIGYDVGVWLDPLVDNALNYLNHSCDPNAGIKGKVTVTALKNIKKGEHITIDYSITECDKSWSLDQRCHCGAKNCRKVIRSIQSLPVIIYRKYLPYIPTVMQREYKMAHSI